MKKWTPLSIVPERFWTERAAVAFLLFLTVCFYLPIRHAGFVYDDRWYVVQNPGLRPFDLSAIFAKPERAAAAESGLAFNSYRPLVTASLALDEWLYGDSPLGFHIENLLLHLINAVLVWIFFRRVIRQPAARWLALAVFLWHPVQVQTVAYVSQRTTLLSSLGMLTTLLLLAPPGPWSWWRLGGGWAAFAFSLLCRETAGGVILILAMLDWLAGQKEPRRWLRYAGLLALTLAFAAVRFHFLRAWSQFAGPRNWGADAALGVLGFAVYLGKLLWPVHLRAHYAYPNPNGLLIAGAAAVALFYFGALVVFALKTLRSRPRGGLATPAEAVFQENGRFCIGVAWVFIFLIPVLQFIPYRGFVSERYLYFSVIGYAWAVAILYQRNPRWRSIFWLAAIYFGVRNTNVVSDWRSNEALWAASVRQDASDAFAQAAYASCLPDPTQAETHFRLALAGNPSADLRFSVLVNLSHLALYRKEFSNAAALANDALALVPGNPGALYALMLAQKGLGHRADAEAIRDRLLKGAGGTFSPVSEK